MASAAPAVRAAEVRLFLTQSQEAFRAGELDSISVDPLGILRLAHRAERLAAIEEPFLLSAAALPGGDGWVIGTGNAGRVLRIDESGKVEVLFTTEEPEVFAVWADAKGAVYAGSSPDGKVYRHADGKTAVFYDPDQTYIWELEGDGKGGLLVATGTEGKLFRVESDGTGKVLYDSDDAHLRSIVPARRRLAPGGHRRPRPGPARHARRPGPHRLRRVGAGGGRRSRPTAAAAPTSP